MGGRVPMGAKRPAKQKREKRPWAQRRVIDRSKSAHGQPAAHGRFFCPAKKRPWAAPSKKLLHDAKKCQCHVIEYSPPVSKNERRGRCRGGNFYLLRRHLWRSMLFGNVVHRANRPPNRQGDDAMLRPQLHYSSRWFAQLCSLRCASMWDLSRR